MSRRKPSGAPVTFFILAIVAAAVLLPTLFPKSGRSSEKVDANDKGLQFGEDFVPALASRDDLGISVVIAVDVSGSMGEAPATGGDPKYIQAAAALAEVARVLERLAATAPPGQVIKAGILKFSSEVSSLLPLTVLDEAGLASLRAVAADPNNFYPGGNTAIGAAIEMGAEWLAQSGTILRSLVLITDGVNTAGADPGRMIEALYANRNSASTEAFPVRTSSTLLSFIGFDISSSQFGKFAALGARVSSAQDREELAKVLSAILEADVTKLEAPVLDGAKK